MLVVPTHELPVAYVIHNQYDKLMHIRQIAVAGSERGKGFGRLLMARILEHARASGCTLVTLTSVVAAIGFFEKLGFQCPCFRRNSFFSEEVVGPVVSMELDLYEL
eukprot:gnl/TRDRNA2_/TRDRNA2_120865_c0_seq1.p1 gnl/TRDRNA2_/TRDRNA2_120865_c0~~gnl/TRDRNA2_/TRDRNA2_120865_c0_seq1.p1  ORF type:complete len:113 (+),score=6.02 gnl/TRDRNA2_/TRDRNA2_120865_c0_seq1:23-340(+)